MTFGASSRRVTGSSVTHSYKESTMAQNDNGMAEKILLGAGYRDLTVALIEGRGEFAATAVKTVGVTGYKAQAMGNTPQAAVASLVKVVTRA